MNKLFRLSTYAKMKGVSTECVRKWAKNGKVKVVVIDDVKFIEISEEHK